MAMSGFLVGDIEVLPIVDIDPFDIAASIIFPDLDLSDLQPHRDWLEPRFLTADTVRLVVRSWLLRVDETTVLIDACVGDHKDRSWREDWHHRSGGVLLRELALRGVGPDDVDFVCCSHFHADHVGWNTQLLDGRWVPTFPKARTLAARTEFDHWQARADQGEDDFRIKPFKDSVLPVHEAGLLDLVDDGYEVTSGLTLRRSPGHTPGHMSVEATRDGARAVFCGDVIHSPIQMLLPGLSSAFCADAAQAAQTRRRLLEDLEDTQALLVPIHFRGSGVCRVKASAGAFRPDFLA